MGLAWGYPNGNIPANVLHIGADFSPLPGQDASVAAGSNLMRADAAIQLSGMQQAFFLARRKKLLLSELYRPMAVQNYYWNRYQKKLPGWTLAALPGTSIHGYALSADLNIGGANPAGDDLAWLRANAAKYGFVNDVSTEPWHWSYRTDLVTRSISIPGFIADPSAVGAAPIKKEDDLVYKMIRNKKTGSIDWICIATGWWQHMPNMDYVNAVNAEYGLTTEDMEDNWHGYYMSLVKKQRADIATAVWTAILSGYNGDQSAAARVAGVDQKADDLSAAAITKLVAALPQSSGGSAAVVNADAIAQKVADLLAKRLES